MATLHVPDASQAIQIPDFAALGKTGIYFLMQGDVVVYVGQARCIRHRVATHIAEGLKVFDSVQFVYCKPKDLDEKERGYIEKLLPKYNKCSLTKSLKVLGVESATGSRLEGKTIRVRLPRKSVRRTITVLA